MKRFLPLLALFLVGCAAPPAEDAQTPAPGSETPTASQGGGEGGIAPMTPSGVPNAPVSGSESLAGAGGGGVQSAAKSAAKNAAAKASGSSASQMPSDGE